MQNQNRKIIMWIGGLGLLMVLLAIPELLIAHAIYPNETEAFAQCVTIMLLVTMFTYLIIATIKFVQYLKIVKEYKRSKVEEAKMELSSEFKKVFIRYSGDISKDMFECKAKVDEDGKIVCEIFLNIKTTFESYEEFLSYFQLDKTK